MFFFISMRFGPTYGNRKARARRPLRRAKNGQWTVFRAREIPVRVTKTYSLFLTLLRQKQGVFFYP